MILRERTDESNANRKHLNRHMTMADLSDGLPSFPDSVAPRPAVQAAPRARRSQVEPALERNPEVAEIIRAAESGVTRQTIFAPRKRFSVVLPHPQLKRMSTGTVAAPSAPLDRDGACSVVAPRLTGRQRRA